MRRKNIRKRNVADRTSNMCSAALTPVMFLRYVRTTDYSFPEQLRHKGYQNKMTPLVKGI